MTAKSTPDSEPKFPCPICGAALDIRDSKKQKPYVVCGVQMFVRGSDGIEKLKHLVTHAETGNAFDRLAEMERRYKKTCPDCGKTFWVTPELMKTSWFDGELTGYKCPAKGCDGVIGVEDEE